MDREEVKYNEALDKLTKLRILAWDPDYIKVTSAERKALVDAERDIIENGTVSHDAIEWE